MLCNSKSVETTEINSMYSKGFYTLFSNACYMRQFPRNSKLFADVWMVSYIAMELNYVQNNIFITFLNALFR